VRADIDCPTRELELWTGQVVRMSTETQVQKGSHRCLLRWCNGRTVPDAVAASDAPIRQSPTSAGVVIATHPDAGVVSFNTGRSMSSMKGQDLTATVIGLGASRSKVIVGGSLGGNNTQVVAWGEKAKLAIRFLDALGRIAATEPAPQSAPEWAPDPYGRHSHRWFDGRTWTDKVADNGETGIDQPTFPLPGVEGWASDPYGRFPHRFADTSGWTSHVARDGQTGVDAVGFPAPSHLDNAPPPLPPPPVG